MNESVRIGSCDALICPYCDSGYLHHECVTDFYQEGTAPETVHYIEKGAAFRGSSPGASYNPGNGSCPGVVIECWCEGCGQRPLLTLGQHKGRTLLKWEPAVRTQITD